MSQIKRKRSIVVSIVVSSDVEVGESKNRRPSE